MPKRSAPKRAARRPKSAASARRAKPAAVPRRPSGRPEFSSVAVVVADRHRAVEWYTQTFGLDHVDDRDHWQRVGRKGGGLLHLCQMSEFDPKATLEPGTSGIAFTLAGDFLAACRALEERGVKFSTPPTKFDWGWGATVVDPDGNEIYLMPE